MRSNLRPIRAPNELATLLAVGAVLAALGGNAAYAQGAAVNAGSAPAAGAASSAPRLNPTGRPVTLTIPAMVGNGYLGDVSLTIEPNDRLEFSSQRVIELLSGLLTDTALQNLRSKFSSKSIISPGDFAGTSITVTYDPQTLQLVFIIPPTLEAARNIAIAPGGQIRGQFVKPANFSAFTNILGSLDYVEQGVKTGVQEPVFLLDSGLWTHGFELESQGVWQPGVHGAEFQRQGSRLVYDYPKDVIRFSAGDLLPVPQGFQGAPQMAGLSLYRSYGVLQPETSVRPSGDQTFILTRPSTVTVTVNGSQVRTMRLDPGTYNLRNFPFSQGANDITLSIVDDTGAVRTLHFNVFFNQTQLAPGISEFGIWVGVKSPLSTYGPHYSDRPVGTAYFRYGVSQNLTIGGNYQVDDNMQMFGGQALFSLPIGTFSLNVAGSRLMGGTSGYAATLTYQRLFEFTGGTGDSLNLAATTRSANFATLGSSATVLPPTTTVPPVTPLPTVPLISTNPYQYELSAGYTHAFDTALYMSLSAHYSKGRNNNPDIQDYHVIGGYRLSDTLGLTVDASYQTGTGFQKGFGALLSLTWSPSATSSVRNDYNTRENDERLSYQNVSGTGVGSYNIQGSLERADDGSGFQGTANYIANRGQIGLTHSTSFTGGDLSKVTDQRTSLHVATAIGYADGAFSVGQPVSQAFAIYTPNRNLGNADVVVNPIPNSDNYTAETGWLGTALEGDLAAYVPRTVTVDAPNAPPGYNLGTGSYRMLPPYRAGYRLEVGSEYSVTAVGRLLQANGKPLSLIAGTATEVDNPSHPPVQMFTNSQGRFGAAGLKPGKWRIEMSTQPVTVYELDVPADAVGVVRAGELKPVAKGK